MLHNNYYKTFCRLVLGSVFLLCIAFLPFLHSANAQTVWYECRCQNNNYTSYRDQNVCRATCSYYCKARGIQSSPVDLTSNCLVGAENDSENGGLYVCQCSGNQYQSFRLAETCADTCLAYCKAWGGNPKADSCQIRAGEFSGVGCNVEGGICNPVNIVGTANIVGEIIRKFLGVVGSIALFMFVYAGITWMLSQGNQDKITHAQKILTWTSLGLLIIFAAYVILQFVFKIFVDLN